jgi:hypothetical protein
MSGHFGFQVVSGRVGSVIRSSSVGLFWVSGRVGSGRLSGHLVLSHFRFWIVSGQVGLVMGSSSVGSFRIFESYRTRFDWIRSDFIIYVSDLVRWNESNQIEFLSDAYLSNAGFTLISIELNSFVFISSILNSSSSIQYKFI